MARMTSLAERRGGPTSRGGPSVEPTRLSHRPPGASAAATRAEKTRSLLGFIENMEAAAVKNELERPPVRKSGQKVQSGETATETATLQFGVGSFDSKRCDIDAKYVEAALRQPKGIRPCTRADL